MPSKKAKKPAKSARRKSRRAAPYAVPYEMGGRLVRALVAGLRHSGESVPLTSHILCACSGGADSTALAILLARYGRRAGDGRQVTLLHVNHGWRGAESDGDEAFVKALARRLKVRFVSRKVRALPARGESWEAHARAERKRIFAEVSEARGGAIVLTAHTADDQAETRLWRILTGAFERLGSGILPRHGVEIRPLLAVRKQALREFLREEGEAWREDASNQDPRFLRVRMRRELMPVIEEIFPRAVEALNRLERPGRPA